MNCDCFNFQPIELDRASINRRIKASEAIKARLEPLTTNTQLRITLFRCPSCAQFWQSGHEWNFADKEYLFQVPSADVAEWLHEPYKQPGAMMIYSAVMRDYFAKNTFELSGSPCREPGCSHGAIRFSVHCRDHHIEALQHLGNLPTKPIGRFFPPYYAESTTVT